MFRSSKAATVLTFCAVLASQPRAFSQKPNKGDARNPIRATGASPGTKPQPTPPNETNKLQPLVLQPLVDAYFRAEKPPARRKILRQITKLKGATIETVATAIRNAKLWDAVEVGVATFSVVQPTINSKPHIARVTVRVPEGYDPARAYPLLFAFPDTGTTGERFTEMVANWLPANSEPFLIAAVENVSGVWLGSDEAEAGGVLTTLDALKHRYHIDTDRVYAIGDGLGGHAAFVVTTLYADAFAATVVVQGTLALQLGPEAAETLLPNLHNTPALVAYRKPNTSNASNPTPTPTPTQDPIRVPIRAPGASPGTNPQDIKPTKPQTQATGNDPKTLTSTKHSSQAVATWNRYLREVAQKANLPLRFLELPATQSEPRAQARGPTSPTVAPEASTLPTNPPPISPPADAFREVLNNRRPHAPKRVAHTFRYLPQGRADWLRIMTFQGAPWTAQRIVVEPALGETKANAIKAILHEKLANISGTIEGQTVRLESRNVDRLELRLNADLLDCNREVTIYLNGDERYTGPAVRKISTMLEIAQEDWDFQRLYSVRFRMSQDGRARQY